MKTTNHIERLFPKLPDRIFKIQERRLSFHGRQPDTFRIGVGARRLHSRGAKNFQCLSSPAAVVQERQTANIHMFLKQIQPHLLPKILIVSISIVGGIDLIRQMFNTPSRVLSSHATSSLRAEPRRDKSSFARFLAHSRFAWPLRSFSQLSARE